ncbi:MAG: hypothetical protein MK102_18405 [Fuerstiella sp.]|nr:hypothetical protein [Fuerstiella sp.]
MKTNDLRCRFIPFVVVGLLLVSGCGDGVELPDCSPVSGRVTYNGEPIGKGVILTYPQGGTLTKNGAGEIVDGEYFLSTYGRGDGAIHGVHKVIITNYEDTTGGPKVPFPYVAISTTPLEITVVPSDENKIDIELADHLE